MHCQMQEPFENPRCVKTIIKIRLSKMLYIGYTDVYTTINKFTMFWYSILKLCIN